MANTKAKKVYGRERWIRLVCKMCDEVFHSTRHDQVTCGPRCRQRYKRQCDAITAQVAADEAAAKAKRQGKEVRK